MKAVVKVRRVGATLVVTLPKHILKIFKAKEGERLTIETYEDGFLQIKREIPQNSLDFCREVHYNTFVRKQ